MRLVTRAGLLVIVSCVPVVRASAADACDESNTGVEPVHHPVAHAVSTTETVTLLPTESRPVPATSTAAMKQCHAVYFSPERSCWFGIDCMVPSDRAHAGVFTSVEVPGVGHVRAWIVRIYTQPRLAVAEAPAEAAQARPKPDEAVFLITVPPGKSLDMVVDGKPYDGITGSRRLVIEGLASGTTHACHTSVTSVPADPAVPPEERMIAFLAGDIVRLDLTTAPSPER